MKKKKKLYLAYGSNLNIDQMLARCPGAAPVGYGQLENYRLLFRGSRTGNYLTVEPFLGASVPFGLWEISEAHERSLDRYEGFPHFYRKDCFRVEYVALSSGDLKRGDAMVYIMADGHPAGLPSSFYFHTCKVGYEDFGLHPLALVTALEETRKEMLSA